MRNLIRIIEEASDLHIWDRVDAFMQDAVDELAPRYPNIQAHIEDDDGQVYLASLAARHQGEGDGTRFMIDLCALLDRHDIVMELEPSPDGTMDDQAGISRLAKWYSGFGFEWVDDYRMRRTPKMVMMESEEQLADIAKVEALRSQMAACAQKVYDAWEQDEDGFDEELGGGGICHLIADEIAALLGDVGVEVTTVSATHEVHVYCVAQVAQGIFEIDVPHRLYERGGGYTWTKLPDVQFGPEDIVIYCLDHRPENFHIYAEID